MCGLSTAIPCGSQQKKNGCSISGLERLAKNTKGAVAVHSYLIKLAPPGPSGPPPLAPAPQLSVLDELHFEFSRPSLNRNVPFVKPFVWWWLITQPRPIWKKAPPGLQRPYHTESGIPGYLYWPNPSVPHLGPDPQPPIPLISGYDPIIKKW